MRNCFDLSNDHDNDGKATKGNTMNNRDITRHIRISDVSAAFGLLTRLPISVDGASANARGAASSWAYPLVGAFIGLASGLIAWVATYLGLPSNVAATFAVAAAVIMTGAMHEDGLADCADGFWGGWDKAQRLEIMKDSHIGVYGVAALVMMFIAKVGLVGALIGQGKFLLTLVLIAMFSRAIMPALMLVLPNAREAGLSSSVGKPDLIPVSIAAGLAILVGVLFFGITVLAFVLVTLTSATFCGVVAKAKIGGQTGDVLGATQQITELALLILAVSLN